ncbi:MAG TPA: AAA family ATPase [Chthoniobacterales bacterium]
MIINKFTIQDFKSIESAELDLGSVNVFIGANGSGKSNLLEAIGVLAAAAFGRVDSESLIRRGCRPSGYFRPLFRESRSDGLTVLNAEAKTTGYQITLSSPESGRSSGWEFKREVWRIGTKKLVDRTSTNGNKGDPQSGLAALRLAETPPKTAQAQFLKTLAAYSIYSPDTPMLRGWMADPQVREPVGLSGGRLAEAVDELVKSKEGGSKLAEELRDTVEWFAGFLAGKIVKDDDPATATHGLAFLDRFFRTDKNHHYFLSANDVNEGVLYELFLGVLCLHPDAPALFAVDNGDHGLNPLLARHLIQAMCGWLLNSKRPRQVLMTTHNPLVLDGLPLQDNRVRLFTVDRDNRGTTNVRRFVITEKHQEMAAKGWTLSRMWVNKLIGGVPNV